MTKYWLFIINDNNWHIVKKLKIIGSRYENRIKLIEKNDIVIIYIKRPFFIITAVYRVSSKLYGEDELFHGGIYPHRLKLDVIKELEQPINFKNLISELEIIKDKKKWGLSLFGRGVKEITKKDFDIVFKDVNIKIG